jgi:hypothetical protein
VRVTAVEPMDAVALLTALRGTRLRGYGGAEPYRDATMRLEAATDSGRLTPAQRYVLAPGVAQILELRRALLGDWDVDLFALNGGLWIATDETGEERIPVIPPIVEESVEPDGRTVMLINDGMHRIYAARSVGLPITVIAVYGVPPEYPYYAFALADGWDSVLALAELADGFEKKKYRLEGNYKALFRDFNAVLPGVQKERKKSIPDRLRA